MLSSWRAVLLVLPALLAASCNTSEPSPSDQAGYVLVEDWPKLPSTMALGQVSGVAVDSHNHVFVFHRGDRVFNGVTVPADPITVPAVLMFDAKSGTLLKSWGANTFTMPHGISIDADDNVWVTDVGLNQVMKFTHDGKRLLTLGEAGVAGADTGHFARPTDIAFVRGCCVLVSDGYINTRVVKFSEDGKFLMQWGTPGSGDGEFSLPHGIAIDRRGRVLVADRSNGRVQAFDTEGRYLTQWKSADLGRPFAMATTRRGDIFIADGGDPGRETKARLVRVDENGTVLATLLNRTGGTAFIAHDVAVGPDGATYLADVQAKKVYKLARGARPQ